MADTLKGKKIRLSCYWHDPKGKPVAKPGDVLTIGDDLEEKHAKDLLAGGSAALTDPRAPTETQEEEG